ncbi:MAG: hypothetical protein LiPW15_226 [Parcubacteria group bacterium LiPW_15]|nr:MAG: hypothetical protein LiPW15_226 [Parcubacteria group bacterium LiPW_15]
MPDSKFSKLNHRSSFTLIELLVTLAIVAILSVVVIMTLNPSELLKQARDSNRLSDLSTLNTALAAYSADVTGGFMGTSSVVYVSIPDTTSTCANLGLPTLPSGWSYNCVTSTSTKLSNGRGWIPVNFSNISFGSPLSSLPVDPVNTTSSRNYYTYVSGGSFQLSSKFESQKYLPEAAKSNSADPSIYVTGNNTNLAPFVGGLVGYWKFDEGSGTTAADSSGYGGSGTASGTTVVAGKIGNARSFNGTTDLVNINDPALGTSQFTVCAWANKTTWKQYGGIVTDYASTGYRDNFILGYEVPSGTIFFMAGNQVQNDNISTTGFTGSVWHHVCGVLDGVGHNLSIYIDGIGNTKSTNVPNIGSIQSTYSHIGRYNSPYYFNGLIDEIRIYKRALSSAEITTIYNATR